MVGDDFNKRTGLLEYAATNDIVIFFPSVDHNSAITKLAGPYKGCWDVTGVTGLDTYFTKYSLQPNIIIDMVNELKYWKTPPPKAFFMGLFLKNVTYAGNSWADFNKKA